MNVLAIARKNSEKKNSSVSNSSEKEVKNLLNKKGAKSSGNIAAKEITGAKKELTKERKGIKAVVDFLATSDSEAAATIRNLVGLAKGANKGAKKALISNILSNYPYVIRNIYITLGDEGDNYISGDCEPCNKNGKAYKDMLPAICDYLRDRQRVIATRKEYATQLLQVRRKRIETGNYNATTIASAMAFTRNNAPGKMPRQKEVAYNYIRG